MQGARVESADEALLLVGSRLHGRVPCGCPGYTGSSGLGACDPNPGGVVGTPKGVGAVVAQAGLSGGERREHGLAGAPGGEVCESTSNPSASQSERERE